MKILFISDQESASLWEYYTRGKLADYNMIISCGDLKAAYLSFLVTMTNKPVLYVHGNHDTKYITQPPEGCDCIDGHFVIYNGLRILGLGGCRKYNNSPFQYTDKQMKRRIAKLKYLLWKYKGVDIVVTHCPPAGYGDQDDYAHRGFDALLKLIDKYHPQYLVHGHVHLNYGANIPREYQYGDTRIINAFGQYTLEIEERPTPVKQLNQVIYKTRGCRLPELKKETF